jgi:hypothetical protein
VKDTRSAKTAHLRTRLRSHARAAAIFAALLSTAADSSRADDLRGADKLLCTALEVTGCWQDEDCYLVSPSGIDMPRFIEVDLEAKRLSTTAASGLNRTSEVQSVKREDGQIVLQGLERARAYSIVLTEETGSFAAAIATDGLGIVVFGACTPAVAASEAVAAPVPVGR